MFKIWAILITFGLFIIYGCSIKKEENINVVNEPPFQVKIVESGVFNLFPYLERDEGCIGTFFGYHLRIKNTSSKPLTILSSKDINECFDKEKKPLIHLYGKRENLKKFGHYESFEFGFVEFDINNLLGDTTIFSGSSLDIYIGPEYGFGGNKEKLMNQFSNLNGKDSTHLKIQGLFKDLDTTIIIPAM